MKKKALLINISDIGDIVSSSIVVDSLLEKEFEIIFLMPTFVHSLFKNDKRVKLISPNEVSTDFYDLLVDLTSDKNSRKLTRKVKAKKKIGRIRNLSQRLRHWVTYTKMVPKKFNGHIVGDYYPILKLLGDFNERLPFLSGSSELPSVFKFEKDDKIVSIHFGAHNKLRLIPSFLLNYAIKNLVSAKYKIILIGTEDEIAEKIIKENSGVPFYEKLTLDEVKSVLLASKLFIGSDSGILHIAGALNVPSIGVYGPNIPARSGPKSKKVTFFQKDIDCRPCNQNIGCHNGGLCMTSLDKEKFVEQIFERLG